MMVNRATRDGSAIAAIDLGSNSLLLLVLGPGGRVLHDSARITRLGEGVFEGGSLSVGAKQRTRRVLRDYARRARGLGAARVVGLGTEALRCARDGSDFLRQLCDEGLLDAAHLLSAGHEAELTLEAARRSLGAEGGPLAVVDVGGGSTEVAWSLGDAPEDRQSVSLELGSVRLSEACVHAHPIAPAELGALREAVTRAACELEPAALAAARERVVAVAGTATTLAALELRLERYEPDAVEGLRLDRSALSGWIDRLSQMSVAARRRLPGMEPGRADVIVAGLLILDGVLERMGAQGFRVSGRGLRHAAALRLLEGRKLV